ncbi:hypothetical protein [Emticicia sp. C21]|uniref:hypothetical protein n=1 Tax=Emticicia sp. C21 TaxID=2302915 RepID=UPI000E349DC6|nr:hypothetical protein [Emticicia sp. C21]RFS18368.1 hypothetical protein D0T08_03720 [Emticicia sp. C21]
MPSPHQQNGGDVLTLPTQKLLLSLSLEDLARFVTSLDMDELIELLHFYEFKERFEACIVVRNHMKDERKRMQEKGSLLVYS